MDNLLFGSDPEIFVCETINNEEWAVPVPYFFEHLGVKEIGFDKTRKHPVILRNERTKVIMDGVAFEFNTTPTNDPKIFYQDVQDTISMVDEFAKQFGYHAVVKPAVKYDFFKYYKPDSELLSWCGVFGCDPDIDAILQDYNSPEIDVTNHIWRYGGGHEHISDYNKLIKDYPNPFIKLLAIYVGNYSVANSPYPELEKQRAFKYGQPGRYRIQNYPDGTTGVEYRSPSNVWVSQLDLIEGMFNQTYKAYELLHDPKVGKKVIDDYLPSTIQAIAEVNPELSKSILSSLE